MSDYIEQMDQAFCIAKERATQEADRRNSKLSLRCDRCTSDSYVPGLECCDCGFISTNSWIVVRSDDWGYCLVPLAAQRTVLATFHIDF